MITKQGLEMPFFFSGVGVKFMRRKESMASASYRSLKSTQHGIF